MISPKEKVEINKVEAQQDLRKDLDDILDRSLSPESIDTYADQAFKDLVGLAERTTEAYSHQPTISADTPKELEDAAFNYYALGDIDGLLNHIAQTADDIRGLDAVIARASELHKIILPPDIPRVSRGTKTGESIQEKEVTPRTKTILFILEKEFGVDVHDRSQLIIQKGITGDEMMRKHSYYLLQIPELHRSIYVCDEEGNATYIFDDSQLEEAAITHEDLSSLTKSDINDLLDSSPVLGRRIIHRSHYISNTISCVKDVTALDSKDRDDVGRYLYPSVPEGYKTIRNLANEIGVNAETVRKYVVETGLSGEKYRIKGKLVVCYPLAQADEVARLIREGTLVDKVAPEGYLNVAEVMRLFHMHHKEGLLAVTTALGFEGEERYRSKNGRPSNYYSPTQVQAISEYLANRAGRPPGGHVTAQDIVVILHTSRAKIESVIQRLNIKGTEYRNKMGHFFTYYSPEELQKVRDYLGEQGFFDITPKGWMNIVEISEYYGVSSPTTRDLANKLNVRGVNYRSPRGRELMYYSPESVEMMNTALSEIKQRREKVSREIASLATR